MYKLVRFHKSTILQYVVGVQDRKVILLLFISFVSFLVFLAILMRNFLMNLTIISLVVTWTICIPMALHSSLTWKAYMAILEQPGFNLSLHMEGN